MPRLRSVAFKNCMKDRMQYLRGQLNQGMLESFEEGISSLNLPGVLEMSELPSLESIVVLPDVNEDNEVNIGSYC